MIANPCDCLRHADLTNRSILDTIEPSNKTTTQEVIEMRYVGNYELRSLNTAQQSFYRKAIVEQWDAGCNGMGYVLRSYGTTVCVVKPITAIGVYPAIYDVAIDMGVLSATTLRHVKEFLAQTDAAFRGIHLDWLRDKVYGEKTVDNGDITRFRKLYAMHEM